eukprot:TRINITY_DN12928_c0_g1_i1.p1 TRINITY_DN12928_c0_g1~~TRINITY_DN12928_c0_g1_i1.p1  ORF type:complete len:452 (-),score=69.40 TRINITY_DN12928_c0_g1_i1:152-1507(-)
MSKPKMQAPVQAFDLLEKESMLNDIWETPKVLKQLMDKHLTKDGVVDIPGLSKPLPSSHGLAGKTPLEVMTACSQANAKDGFKNKFTIIGSGTSWHAALLAEYLIEHTARIPCEVQYASEFRFRTPLLSSGDVLVVISNSGETADAVESLRQLHGTAKRAGVVVVAIVNEADSTIAKESDLVLDIGAGPEIGITSTKGFSATGCMCSLLAVALGKACGTLDKEYTELIRCLRELPDCVQEVIEHESKPLLRQVEDKFQPPARKAVSEKENVRPPPQAHSLGIGECALWDVGCQNVLAQNFIFLGRGFNFPIALEGATKCKELAYIHAEGYPAAEMKHGPIALIDRFMPIVCIAPRKDPSYEKIKANIEEVKARSGFTIAITEKGPENEELKELCEYVVEVPETHEYLMPLITVIPLQLLAFMMGVLRGKNVDSPSGLVRTVTKSNTRKMSQ